MAEPAQGIATAGMFDRRRLAPVQEWLAVALAISLPWSTSATGILVVLWLLALIPTLTVADVRREVATPAGGLPVLLWACGVAGMLWADVSWAERLNGLNSFHKLLIIPLLFVQFRRGANGRWVLFGFIASCTVLMVLSWESMLLAAMPWQSKAWGILVKDPISQGAMFAVCIFALADLALSAWRAAQRRHAVAMVALALAFLANILAIATSRTTLVAIPLLLVLFGLKRVGWKGTAVLLAGLLVVAAAAWPLSEPLQRRVGSLYGEVLNYRSDGAQTSAGERLEFWRKSVGFVAEAPLIGHGTGTIAALFARASAGQIGVGGVASHNPHNQTLAVAIQLGVAGTAVLWAMWVCHLLLFRGPGLAAWIGLAVVTQNIIGSLFNSHLFDFTHGWLYVVGMGIAGGIALREAEAGWRDGSKAGMEGVSAPPTGTP